MYSPDITVSYTESVCVLEIQMLKGIIKEAVTAEKITEQRYNSYCSLYDSL